MFVEIRSKTDPSVRRCYFLCEVCRAESPHVERTDDLLIGVMEAMVDHKARAAGWAIHMECVRTEIQKRLTGSWRMQYFCPNHKDKAGTIPAIKPSRKKADPCKKCGKRAHPDCSKQRCATCCDEYCEMHCDRADSQLG